MSKNQYRASQNEKEIKSRKKVQFIIFNFRFRKYSLKQWFSTRGFAFSLRLEVAKTKNKKSKGL